MIRFLPDTWSDALLRPVAMAMPDGWVYVETMAPDFRFVFVLLLLILLTTALLWRRKPVTTARKPMLILLAVTVAAFVLWMLTTGNGRYFIAFLLVVGPLCIAMVYLLPMTQGFRLTLAVLLVGVQGFVVHESGPFQSWGLAQWTAAPYFQVDVPPDMKTQARSYVTMSSISYSLIAPQFPPASRWMNISDAPRDGQASIAGQKVQSFLAEGGDRLTLLVPSIPSHATEQGLPDAEVIKVLNALLLDYKLSIEQPAACSFMRSKGALSVAKINPETDVKEAARKIGFWVCPLRYPTAVRAVQHEVEGGRFDNVFDKVEALCPRFFPPKSAKTLLINNGELRHYKGTDMKVYVWSDGTVMYRYFRTYSPEMIGTVADVLSGNATLDCNKLRGRSGLPWEREI